MLIPAIMVMASVLVAQSPKHEILSGPAIVRLSDQEREEAMDFVRAYGGAMRLRRLENLRLAAPLKFEQGLRRALVKKREVEKLKERDPKLYKKVLKIMELERKSFDLAEDYRNTEDETEKENIKNQLMATLSEQFSLKEEEKNARMKKLEDKLARLKDELMKREKNKKEVVNRRLKDLLGENRYLEW